MALTEDSMSNLFPELVTTICKLAFHCLLDLKAAADRPEILSAQMCIASLAFWFSAKSTMALLCT